MRREATIERRLCDEVRRLGGRCYKLEGTAGLPDRMCIMPGGKIIFVELKSETGHASALQRMTLMDLTRLGCDARLVKGSFELDCFLGELRESV